MWTTEARIEHFDVKQVFVEYAEKRYLSQKGIGPKRALNDKKDWLFVHSCSKIASVRNEAKAGQSAYIGNKKAAPERYRFFESLF